jgi:hypothetical protein
MQEIGKLDKDLIDGKVSKQKAWSDVFSAFLKGDVNKAVEAAGQIVQGEASAWQRDSRTTMRSFKWWDKWRCKPPTFWLIWKRLKLTKP